MRTIFSTLIVVVMSLSNLNAAPTRVLKSHYDVSEYATIEDAGGSAVVRHLNSAKKVAGGFRRGIAKKNLEGFCFRCKWF